MLNGIINIKPGSGYENSNSKLKYSSRILNKVFGEKDNLNDSVILSPALQFLIHVNWKLKQFKYKKNLLNITFDIDDLEFQTEIDLERINSLTQIYYKVTEQLMQEEEPSLVQAKLIYYFNDEFDFQINDIKPHALKIFFNRFLDSESYLQDYSNNDEVHWENIVDNLEEELNEEFKTISSILIVFLEKYSGSQIIIGKDPDDSITKNLIILDVKKISTKE